jgi:hypothetical protein
MDAETTPAFTDLKLAVKSTGEPVMYEEPKRQYRIEGFKASAQIVAEMGGEVNGKYYKATQG